MYIGSYHHRIAVAGAGFDNIQIFNKALTREEITILALANKDVMTD